MEYELNLQKLKTVCSVCSYCDISSNRKISVFSKGNEQSSVLLCGMCPGPDENSPKNSDGLPFVGGAGKLLDEILSEVSLDLDKVYITNIVKCYVKPGIKLHKGWVENCFPYFISEVALVNPKVIVTLGKDAFCGLFGETEEAMGNIRKKSYEFFGSVVVPTYHPSYILRGGGKDHKDYEKIVTDLNKSASIAQR